MTDLVVIAVSAPVTLGLIYLLVRSLSKRAKPVAISQMGVVDRIREMGDLVALTAFYKDIATAKEGDSLWGLFEGKKMAVISEFDLEYRYDLHKAEIRMDEIGKVAIHLPECRTKVNTGAIEIYHEQKGTLLGLIPLSSFGVEDRNKLLAMARGSAVDTAQKKTQELLGKIEKSARDTLTTLLTACGVTEIEIDFTRSGQIKSEIEKQVGAIGGT